MADTGQEKTEQPTHRRRQRARQRGQVVKSIELQSALGILSAVLVLRVLGPGMHDAMLQRFADSLARVGRASVTIDTLPQLLGSWVIWFGWVVGPLALLLGFGTALGLIAIQGGVVFSSSALAPQLERINPISGAKRLVSGRMLFQLGRDLLKLLVIGVVCWFTVRSGIEQILLHYEEPLTALLGRVGAMTVGLVLRIAVILLLVGLLDYAYQKRQFIQELKMTKKEVKDEVKESEGDPLIKGRQKSQQRDLARRRMLQAVPEADVVLTNPTHIAVALKYDAGSMAAPTVIAKGQRLIAEKIKEIARRHGVPVVENKPLARALFKLVPLGAEIPSDLYRAVAEVLSYVYRLKNKRLPGRTTDAEETP